MNLTISLFINVLSLAYLNFCYKLFSSPNLYGIDRRKKTINIKVYERAKAIQKSLKDNESSLLKEEKLVEKKITLSNYGFEKCMASCKNIYLLCCSSKERNNESHQNKVSSSLPVSLYKSLKNSVNTKLKAILEYIPFTANYNRAEPSYSIKPTQHKFFLNYKHLYPLS